jgi:hypothetical protein
VLSACFDDLFFSCFSSSSRFFFFPEQSQNLLADLGRCAEKFLKEASRYGEVSLHDALRPAFVSLHAFQLDHGCHQILFAIGFLFRNLEVEEL